MADGEDPIEKWNYGEPLREQIRNCLDNYRDSRSGFIEKWSDRKLGDAPAFLRVLQSIASTILSGVGDFGSQEVRQPVLDALTSQADTTLRDKLLEFAFEEVELYLADEACKLMDTSHERFTRLLLMTQSSDPSWRAAAFLKRVGRCYLHSFDPECVVMCRSVLESEFEAEICNDECIQLLDLPPRQHDKQEPIFTLYQRILVAKLTKRIGARIADKAHSVRKAGRHEVHKWPESEDALPVIAKTLQVISALHRKAA